MRTNNRELLIEKYIPPTETRKSWVKLWKNKNGQLHSFNDQPSFIRYSENGNKRWCFWYKNGKEHRDKGRPSYICYNRDGKITCKSYSKNDVKYK